MRSLLAVPATNPRFLEKGAQSAADAVFIDLEDAVVPELKVEARAKAIAAINTLDWGSASSRVRVNDLGTEWGVRRHPGAGQGMPAARSHPAPQMRDAGGRAPRWTSCCVRPTRPRRARGHCAWTRWWRPRRAWRTRRPSPPRARAWPRCSSAPATTSSISACWKRAGPFDFAHGAHRQRGARLRPGADRRPLLRHHGRRRACARRASARPPSVSKARWRSTPRRSRSPTKCSPRRRSSSRGRAKCWRQWPPRAPKAAAP